MRPLSAVRFLALMVTLFGISFVSSHAYAKLIFHFDEESVQDGKEPKLGVAPLKNFQKNGDDTGWGPGSSITGSTDVFRSGKKSLKFTVNYSGLDPDYPRRHLPDDGRDNPYVNENIKHDTYRALIHGHHLLGEPQAFVPVGEEFWVGFSTYYPKNYVADTKGYGELHFQVKQEGKGPMIALHVGQKHGQKHSVGVRTFNKKDKKLTKWEGKFVTGEWVDWVYNFKLSAGNDGFVKVWRNGEIIVDFKGRTTDVADKKHTLAFGIYRYSWRDKGGPAKVDKRTIYMDDVRMGDANSSYAEVAPGGGSVIPPDDSGPADPEPPVAGPPPG